jgi:hypothetical protein
LFLFFEYSGLVWRRPFNPLLVKPDLGLLAEIKFNPPAISNVGIPNLPLRFILEAGWPSLMSA